jgi:hypothetical protein
VQSIDFFPGNKAISLGSGAISFCAHGKKNFLPVPQYPPSEMLYTFYSRVSRDHDIQNGKNAERKYNHNTDNMKFQFSNGVAHQWKMWFKCQVGVGEARFRKKNRLSVCAAGRLAF